MAKSYLLGERFLERVKTAVDRVEGLPIGSGGFRIQTRLDQLESQQPQKTFRICTFTGSWPIGTTKTVTLWGTQNTVEAFNLVCGMDPTGPCDVSIARDGTTWYLVQPNLTQQPGYSASGTQVLTIQNGSLRWVGTTACT